MATTTIENPILNSPYTEPNRHFEFDDEGITDKIIEKRRESAYFVPIAQPRRQSSKQLEIATEWTQDRVKSNQEINRIRDRIEVWRRGKYAGITNVTRRLLEHWKSKDREPRLFFCQIEALETFIYLTEVAKKYGDTWIENMIREKNDMFNPGLNRIACKMATGTGKTFVMGMLIAWHTLNKLENPQDNRFSDTFLIIAPGITIKDRLRVLLPSDPDNYYRKYDLVPAYMREQLGRAKIIIANFHKFKLRELSKAPRLTKKVLRADQTSAFTETPDQMVRRVCRDLGNKKKIIVINDEAHHCYRKKEEAPKEKLTRDERSEAKEREEKARVWISGMEAVQKKIGIRAIYDLSATPFFLQGSGYGEGTLFPWVVSDFSLIDAIESGIVKVPRVPVSDDAGVGTMPTYRNLWPNIRDHLPKKGRRASEASVEPNLPTELEGALISLYGNYEKSYKLWEGNSEARDRGLTPPVFIVVCNNTTVSKMVYDHISGWEKTISEDQTVLVPGKLAIFSNVKDSRWMDRPNTILVDSTQLESGEAMSDEFKKIAAREIEEFKAEMRQRFPGRDTDKLTDEDILREVMNTVGKSGKLGEHIRCVVSVSMLTEGWDANTVTHILGVRAFGTQLLCEQVVGRGLRRLSFALNENDKFSPEYAEVYGVPFSFIPCSGSTTEVLPPVETTHVRAIEERKALEITFPRLTGYKYEINAERLHYEFTEDSRFVLSTTNIPTKTELAPIVGETVYDTLDEFKKHRENEVAFYIAKTTLERYFRDDDGNDRQWLFPQILEITRRWLKECVHLKDNTFIQLMLLVRFAHNAAEKIYQAIASSEKTEPVLKPILRSFDNIGSSKYVDFDTVKPTYRTPSEKCHVSHIVCDTLTWEQKMAEALESMDEVHAYVKNDRLGFTIPYTLDGEQRNYYPDFIIKICDGQGNGEMLNLIVEVTGRKKEDKAVKVATARKLWTPAVNNHGGLGRWKFIEITDPWDAKHIIRKKLQLQGEG